jgi:hypothetical protein
MREFDDGAVARARTLVMVCAAGAALVACAPPDLYYRHADAGGGERTAVTTGAAGTTSAAGATGAAGTTSAAGVTGAAGTTSAAGVTGAAGTTSAAGATGAVGAAGTTGGPPAPDARLTSDFEDGMPTGWIADTVDGTWAVVADGTGKVYEQQMSSSTLSLAIGGKINWADQVVETRVKWVSFSSSSALVYLAVRYQNKDAYYFVALKADGSLKIRKRVMGSTDDVATYKSNMPIVKDTWYTLGLSAVGTTLTASLNGAMVATGTATDLQTGGIALGTQNAVAAFDDVKVTPP